MSWTDARIEQLKTLVSEGGTGGYIAQVMGLTRNAVIGKAHRLGLLLAGYAHGANPRTLNGGGHRSLRAAPKPLPAHAPSVIRADVERIERELPETDDGFAAAGCRWPIGEVNDSDFRFCQRVRHQHSCWCPEHHALGHMRG